MRKEEPITEFFYDDAVFADMALPPPELTREELAAIEKAVDRVFRDHGILCEEKIGH